MGKWIIRALLLLAVVLLVLWLRNSVLAPKPVAVETVAVELGRVEETVTNSRAGTVRSRRRARLSPEVGGRVMELPFREGERVVAGDLLLRLEDDIQQARLRLTEGDLAVARADNERACLAADRAQRELERSRLLTDIVSADRLDQLASQAETAAASCRAAAAGIARAEAAVVVARTELRQTVLRAPFDAIVAELSIELGEWSTPSPPVMAVPAVIDLIDPSSIYVSAPMDEVDSARIFAGMEARLTVDSHRHRSLAARVARVAPYVLDVEQQNRTVEIEVIFDDAEFAASLLPGTSADVEVVQEVREESLRVPTLALIDGSKVLIIDGDHLTEREVEVGLRNWDFTEILSGVKAGEQVVTSLDRAEVIAGALIESDDEVDR